MCYPEADILSVWARARGGKLVLTAEDARATSSQRLRRLFGFETIRTGKPVLVEKLPINNFRLPFIYAIFPDARFVHIVRNGIEVARSIENMAKQIHWFGRNEYKWHQLARLASEKAATAGIADLCANDYERGLLEWRLGTEAVHNSCDTIPKESFLEITYADLVDRPVKTMNTVLAFIGLEQSTEMNDFLVNNIRRRSVRVTPQALSHKEMVIAGELLQRFATT